MKKVIYVLAVVVLISIMLISIYCFYRDYADDKKEESIYDELLDIVGNTDNDNVDNELIIGSNISSTENEITNYTELFNMNSDMVAWIKIYGTKINYPVMQTKGNQNYYLSKNFYKQNSTWGTPFVQENCDIDTSDNIIIYAHHIRNNNMFGALEKFKSQEYCEEHKEIELITKNEVRKYEIIAVFKTDIETGFKYYEFVKSQNEDEFNTFVRKCKELSLFNIDSTATYGDRLLTLSTCEYSTDNGRLVVIAKEVC